MDSMFNTLLARALAGGSGGGGGGTGTDDYTDLNNKPKVNNVTVVGNLTSSDLKLQGEITNSHKLSADLVDDSTSTNKFNVQADWDQTINSAPDYIKNKPTLGTAAATDATAYATAAQGTKADSAIQTVEVNGTALTPTSAKAVNITVPTQASDINALPNTTKYATTLSLTIDSSTFVVTGQLKDQNGDNLGAAQTIDLPLESVVVGGSFDSQTKKVILTLQNGNTIEFSVADLVSGLQTELSATNKLDPSFINYDTTHAAVTESDKTTWSGKQDALTFDGTYSASTNKAATVSTVTNAVNALDVTGDASVSASKTISAWSETDGKVSISTQDIAIVGTQTTLTGYAKSGTAGQAVAATDNVNQAIGKLEATVDDNKNNISLLETKVNTNAGIISQTYNSTDCNISLILRQDSTEDVYVHYDTKARKLYMPYKVIKNQYKYWKDGVAYYKYHVLTEGVIMTNNSAKCNMLTSDTPEIANETYNRLWVAADDGGSAVTTAFNLSKANSEIGDVWYNRPYIIYDDLETGMRYKMYGPVYKITAGTPCTIECDTLSCTELTAAIRAIQALLANQ